jgi:flagellar motor switch protein FliN
MAQPPSNQPAAPSAGFALVAGDRAGTAANADRDVVARPAEFAPLSPNGAGAGLGSLDHLLDVTVTVTAELGRVTRPISDVLKYGLGAVVELDRTVTEPVDLFVQGVRIARGEVVVVDDKFAVRIIEIADPKKRKEKQL